ncbi:MAG: UDP-glucose/GDP-mannose dehydrogenase family protein [Ignavibacteria bacterium]|nr:UDP-glucose/GDP-mannose dehydrogenase family protein [Ignavibacteria bacterium]
MSTISVIGTGYVGLVTGVCLSEFGIQVLCMDTDEEKIKQLSVGKISIFEPGLENLLLRNLAARRIKFTTDYKEAVEGSETIFIAVGTPPYEDGSADLRFVLSAAKSIAENINGYKVIVNKSTVPVGTARKVSKVIEDALTQRGAGFGFDIVSNPEFLREGSAVRDFMHPDRIIIGCDNERAKQVMKDIYNVLYLIETPFVFTGIETAELIKYASNAYLATKITFINEIANLCEKVGADVHDVSKAMGLDGRIGKYYLHPGPGYGGSCFPKDTKALVNIGKEYNTEISVVSTVIGANERQKHRMVLKIENALGELKGCTIALLGIAFKPETDDIREAPAIDIIKELIKKGAKIKAYDPAAINNAKNGALKNFDENDIFYSSDEYEAIENADALVILTEWNQFRHLDLIRIKKLMRRAFFFDFRNVYERNQLEALGYYYEGVGR